MRHNISRSNRQTATLRDAARRDGRRTDRHRTLQRKAQRAAKVATRGR